MGLETCETCRHWERLDQTGRCRRYPPTVVERKGYLAYRFPETAETERCGEWWPRAEPEDVEAWHE